MEENQKKKFKAFAVQSDVNTVEQYISKMSAAKIFYECNALL